PLRVDRFHHGMHVLHPRLQRRERAAAIGEPTTALVEEDQPERLREPLVQRAPVLRFPGVDEVRTVARDEDEIGVPVPEDLVGDPAAAAAHIADVWPHDGVGSRTRLGVGKCRYAASSSVPSRSRTPRGAASATCGSWVITITVLPPPLDSDRSSSTISSPVA